MSVPLPALLFSNPVKGVTAKRIDNYYYFEIMGRVDSDKGVLPDDLILLAVKGSSLSLGLMTAPMPYDTKGSPGGDPWSLIRLADYGGNDSPKIALWARRVTLREARQTTGWRVGLGSNDMYTAAGVGVARFAYGWHRWPMPWRTNVFAGTTDSEAYQWPGVTTYDARADSIPDAGTPGQGLSSTLVIGTGDANFGGLPSPTVGTGWESGGLGIFAEYCRHDGGVIPAGGVPPYDNPYNVFERYVTMTVSIAPPPNVVFPTGDRPVRQIGQSFTQNLDGFTVSGAGSAYIA